MSTTELPKTYDPAAVEATAYQTWLDEKCFHPSPTDAGEPYSIVIPPPNVTGALHLGHAINNTLQDILTRKARMEGKNALWIPGVDHAGIATQAVVEKQLKEKEGLDRHQVGRDGLVERIWQWKQQYGDRIVSQLKRLGCSCDWDRQRFTLDDMCARAVRETFFKLFKDGLIYRGKRLVNWDTHLLTSISDDELYTETVKTSMWHIKYEIVEGNSEVRSLNSEKRGDATFPLSDFRIQNSEFPKFMTVATTRPETMLADTAVAVHPDDARWNWAIGKQVKLPLTGRLIPIIGDPILVDMAFGSGVVKVTPAHDPNDYAVYTRHKGTPSEIAIVNLMTPDGRVNDADGSWSAYTGLTFAAARKKVVEDLIASGFMTEADIKPHEANVSFSDRSKTAIQPYLSDQWFVKMAPLAEPALEVVRDGTIKFFPERHAQQYLSWLGEKRDWPISRQLWWGHRIPVWRRALENSEMKPGPQGEADTKLDPTQKIIFDRNGMNLSIPMQFMKDDSGIWYEYLCPPAGHPDVDAYLSTNGYEQDPDVLDTWFSSALWPHSTLGWPEQTADLAKWYPTSVLMTGRDIITLWVARMVMMGIYNIGDASSRGMGVSPMRAASMSDPIHSDRAAEATDSNKASSTAQQHGRDAHATTKPAIPFSHVAINPTILDGRGERMSKSKGNGVDPVDVIETHGADALRFTLTTMATETQDVRMPVKKLPDGRNTSDKFDLGRNFANKLWNACRFALANLELATEARRHGGATDDLKSGEKTAAKKDGLNENHGTTSAPPCLRASVVLSLPDRWIISRFNRTVDEANKSLAVYRFDQYAKLCYDFFWRDFCDWYVEAIKPAIKRSGTTAADFSPLVPPSAVPVSSDEAKTNGLKSAAGTLDVLAAVIDGALRLMHPMIPFITETIFWQLNTARPQRGIAGLLECPPSERLIKAKWPTAGPVDDAAEAVMEGFQALIVSIRNVRNTYKVDPKKSVNVTILAPASAATELKANVELIETLATCKLLAVLTEVPANVPEGVRANAGACEVFIEGLVDVNAEKARVAKERDDLSKQIAAMKGRLSDEAYTAKAPAHLVEQTKAQLAEAEAKLAKLG